MHYRWNFPEENLEFLNYHFFNAQRAGPNRQEKTDYMMDKMRFAGRMFGVSDTNHNFIEELYMDFLKALNEHFSNVPYLLGWKPCIGGLRVDSSHVCSFRERSEALGSYAARSYPRLSLG